MKKCDSCGKTVNDSKELFCPHCGAIATKSTVCTHTETEDRWNRENTSYSFHSAENSHQNKSFYKNINGDEKNSYSSSYANVFEQMKKTLKNSTVNTGKQQTQKSKTSAVFIVVFSLIFLFSAFSGIIGESDLTDYENDYSEEYVSSFCNNAEIQKNENGLYSLKINSLCFTGNGNFNELSNLFAYSDCVSCCLEEYNSKEQSFFEEYYELNSVGTGEFEFEKTDFKKNVYYSIYSICFFAEAGGAYQDIFVNLPFSAFCITDDGKIEYYKTEYDENNNVRFLRCKNVCETPYDDYVQYDYNR